jgi:hypothetical protein
MGEPPRKRGFAQVSDKPWVAANSRSGDGPRTCEAKTVARRKPRSLAWDQNHGKAQSQEGQIGRRNTNHGPVMRIDSDEAKDPEDG